MTSDPEQFEPPPLAHPVDEGGARGRGRNDIRVSPWNLLLLLPLLMLVTAWYNSDTPRLFGLPFFYWFQFVYVFVGVACVWIVYLTTRHIGNARRSDDTDGTLRKGDGR